MLFNKVLFETILASTHVAMSDNAPERLTLERDILKSVLAKSGAGEYDKNLYIMEAEDMFGGKCKFTLEDLLDARYDSDGSWVICGDSCVFYSLQKVAVNEPVENTISVSTGTNKKRLFELLDVFFNTERFKKNQLLDRNISNETYGEKSCIYVHAGTEKRKALECFLVENGFVINEDYSKGGGSLEVEVEYFKGCRWAE